MLSRMCSQVDLLPMVCLLYFLPRSNFLRAHLPSLEDFHVMLPWTGESCLSSLRRGRISGGAVFPPTGVEEDLAAAAGPAVPSIPTRSCDRRPVSASRTIGCVQDDRPPRRVRSAESSTIGCVKYDLSKSRTIGCVLSVQYERVTRATSFG